MVRGKSGHIVINKNKVELSWLIEVILTWRSGILEGSDADPGFFVVIFTGCTWSMIDFWCISWGVISWLMFASLEDNMDS